jgi:tetratricopeptide (TPR) repeat protein
MDAMWTLRKLREMDPDNAGLLMEGAVVAKRVNRPREAIALFSEWDPAGMPGGPSLFAQRFRLTELSELHHYIGEDERALEFARSAIEIFPEDLDSRTDELVALASLGRTEEVEAALENWFTMWSQGWARPGRLSWALEELKRHGYREKALNLAERAIRWCEARASSGEPHRWALAVALYQAERWDEAAALYAELAREYPDRMHFQWPLGTLAARRDDRDEARRVLEGILEINDPYLYGADEYGCACIAAQLGDLDRAVSFLSDAMSHGYGLTAQAHHAIDLEPLWDYPPFQEFMMPKG